MRSLSPGKGRAPIDLGQHLMLGCYHESLSLLRRLDTEHLLKRVEDTTPFVSDANRIHPFRLGKAPTPFHALPALASLTQSIMSACITWTY